MEKIREMMYKMRNLGCVVGSSFFIYDLCLKKKKNFLSLVEKQIGSSNDFLGVSNVHFPLFRDIFSLIFATISTFLPVTCFQKKLLLSKEKRREGAYVFTFFFQRAK